MKDTFYFTYLKDIFDYASGRDNINILKISAKNVEDTEIIKIEKRNAAIENVTHYKKIKKFHNELQTFKVNKDKNILSVFLLHKIMSLAVYTCLRNIYLLNFE